MDYKEKIKILTEIVNEADPVGLIALGSPPDEYSAEVMSILSLITKKDKWGQSPFMIVLEQTLKEAGRPKKNGG